MTSRLALLAGLLAAPAWAGDVAALWKAKCATCHGEDGRAQTKTGKKEKINDMTDAEWQSKWTDEKMKEIIVDGSKDNAKMKAYKTKLSEADIDALIQRIREFKGP